jgi:hypothetical protein
MDWSHEIKSQVFDKTGGRCVYCGTALFLDGYGLSHLSSIFPGVWEIDPWTQSSSLSQEDLADRMEFLFPACLRCTHEKGDLDGRSYTILRMTNNQPVAHWALEALPPGLRGWLAGAARAGAAAPPGAPAKQDKVPTAEELAFYKFTDSRISKLT